MFIEIEQFGIDHLQPVSEGELLDFGATSITDEELNAQCLNISQQLEELLHGFATPISHIESELLDIQHTFNKISEVVELESYALAPELVNDIKSKFFDLFLDLKTQAILYNDYSKTHDLLNEKLSGFSNAEAIGGCSYSYYINNEMNCLMSAFMMQQAHPELNILMNRSHVVIQDPKTSLIASANQKELSWVEKETYEKRATTKGIFIAPDSDSLAGFYQNAITKSANHLNANINHYYTLAYNAALKMPQNKDFLEIIRKHEDKVCSEKINELTMIMRNAKKDYLAASEKIELKKEGAQSQGLPALKSSIKEAQKIFKKAKAQRSELKALKQENTIENIAHKIQYLHQMEHHKENYYSNKQLYESYKKEYFEYKKEYEKLNESKEKAVAMEAKYSMMQAKEMYKAAKAIMNDAATQYNELKENPPKGRLPEKPVTSYFARSA